LKKGGDDLQAQEEANAVSQIPIPEPKAVEPDAKGVSDLVAYYCYHADRWYYLCEECHSKAVQPRWIPVAESLPKDHLSVICLTNNGSVIHAHRAQGNWRYSSGSDYGELTGLDVTYWMQIPPAPVAKTQQQEDEEAFEDWALKYHDAKSERMVWHAACAYRDSKEKE
jgi:hypothetical protein